MSVLNFYCHEKNKGVTKPSIIYISANKLQSIWNEFIAKHNVLISLLSLRAIESEVKNLIDEWQDVQKTVNRVSVKKQPKKTSLWQKRRTFSSVPKGTTNNSSQI